LHLDHQSLPTKLGGKEILGTTTPPQGLLHPLHPSHPQRTLTAEPLPHKIQGAANREQLTDRAYRIGHQEDREMQQSLQQGSRQNKESHE
jgi:hypothetical protein